MRDERFTERWYARSTFYLARTGCTIFIACLSKLSCISMGQVKVLAVGSIKKDAAWTGRLILGIMQSLVAVVIGIAYYVGTH